MQTNLNMSLTSRTFAILELTFKVRLRMEYKTNSLELLQCGIKKIMHSSLESALSQSSAGSAMDKDSVVKNFFDIDIKIIDVVKSHSGKFKSKSSYSEIVNLQSIGRKFKSKSTGRKFKSSSSTSPQVLLSFDLSPKKRQNLSAPYNLTTSQRNVCLNEKSEIHFTNVCDPIRCKVHNK